MWQCPRRSSLGRCRSSGHLHDRRPGMISDPVVERVVKIIAEAIHPQKIILFGSRAQGTARPDSDLDLVIIYAGEKVQAADQARRPPFVGTREFAHGPFSC